MIGADGPKLIEYNVRFGDPESGGRPGAAGRAICSNCCSAARRGACRRRAAILARGRADRGARGARLSRRRSKGSEIRGIEARRGDARRRRCTACRHAADGGAALADGGRVLAVTALGRRRRRRRSARAYAAVDAIDWPEGFCRRDIGWRAIARERGADIATWDAVTGTRRLANRAAHPPRLRSRVALGGGGARGIAHIAVLEAFDEFGVKPRGDRRNLDRRDHRRRLCRGNRSRRDLRAHTLARHAQAVRSDGASC